MWAELYINDPDILSDVTEIAVKKLGYWSESRSRDDRSLALFLHARSCTHASVRALPTHERRWKIASIKQRGKSRDFTAAYAFFVRARSETVTTTMDHS